MSVLLPSSTLPHVMKRRRSFPSRSARKASMSTCSPTCSLIHRPYGSEVTLPLLLLHRPLAVPVDHAPLPLGHRAEDHLADDLGHRLGVALDGAGQRIAAERAEAHPGHRRLLARIERHA